MEGQFFLMLLAPPWHHPIIQGLGDKTLLLENFYPIYSGSTFGVSPISAPLLKQAIAQPPTLSGQKNPTRLELENKSLTALMRAYSNEICSSAKG